MYSSVFPLTLPSWSNEQRTRLLAEAPIASLSEVFDPLPDPRRRAGRRYSLAYLLTCLVAALLWNGNSSVAVSQWCREQQARLARLFGSLRFRCPSDSLSRKWLPHLSAEQVEWAIADWVQATVAAAPDDPIALDGKTVRGAGTEETKAPHLLSFSTHRSQEVLLQMRVEAKTNEIPVAQFLLPTLPVRGRVLTADAMQTQVAFIDQAVALGADVLLTVKANQPALYEAVALSFADPLAQVQIASTTDLHKGRTGLRLIRVSTEMNAYLNGWPHLAQVAQLTRTVTIRKTGQSTGEVGSLLTTLTTSQTTPDQLLELVRGHWSIENALHGGRDVTDREKIARAGALVMLLNCWLLFAT